MNPFSNKWIVGGIALTILLQLALVYLLPSVGVNVLRTEAFPAQWWLLILSLAFPVLLIVELEEFLVNRLQQRFNKDKSEEFLR